MPYELDGSNAGSNEWYYFDQSLWHKRKETNFPDLPSLNELKTQQLVGIQITPDGDFNLFIDGRFMKTIASNLPVHQAIFGAVDVGGDCTKIKSDILSGELDGVCMDVFLLLCAKADYFSCSFPPAHACLLTTSVPAL